MSETLLEELAADGLILPEIKPHSLKKYRLIAYAATLFSSGMKNKWSHRIYIDLFAGAGASRVSGSNKVELGSPLIGLSVNDPFTKYIFCEYDSEKLTALKQRTNQHFYDANIEFVQGNCNDRVEEILSKIPRHSAEEKVLCLCIVDPFGMSSFKFLTIEKLSRRFMDFLVLIPTKVDAHRNLDNYLPEKNKIIDDYLGDKNWRIEWKEANLPVSKFGPFIFSSFIKRMYELGFKESSSQDNVSVGLKEDGGVQLYNLVYFSKNKLGQDFWRKSVQGTSPQMGLFE